MPFRGSEFVVSHAQNISTVKPLVKEKSCNWETSFFISCLSVYEGYDASQIGFSDHQLYEIYKKASTHAVDQITTKGQNSSILARAKEILKINDSLSMFRLTRQPTEAKEAGGLNCLRNLI